MREEEINVRKVINNKMYDTATATLVAEYLYGDVSSDSSYEEKLYLKVTGEFFLYGEGGGLSKYQNTDGRNTWCGSAIVPLSNSEAREWVAEHCARDVYKRLFGPNTEP